MKKRIVIALGGNALGNTLPEQKVAVKSTAKAIVDLIEAGNEVIVAHGNGPQVGMIQKAMTALHKLEPEKYVLCPLSVCVAMSQGYIGHDLQNALREELQKRGIKKSVTTVLTQVEVSAMDPAFEHPTKPIGAYVTGEEARRLKEERGFSFAEDAGRGVRRVVPSPKPLSIVELDSIRGMVEEGQVVIACGGGGIPVVRRGENEYEGVEAIIDKDFASCTLAKEIGADYLIILTAVEKVAVNFGKPDQRWLDSMTSKEARRYMEEGQFAPGSMLPKVMAALEFAESGAGRTSLITLLEKAKEGIEGKTGTLIGG
ncbi:carbamate kinase [bacterium D16-54]|nr:carbamate kinase [bacterium D16-54]RKJ14693.1 carbamate kinase [bacterium D16-56]